MIRYVIIILLGLMLFIAEYDKRDYYERMVKAHTLLLKATQALKSSKTGLKDCKDMVGSILNDKGFMTMEEK